MRIAICDDELEIRDTIKHHIRVLYSDVDIILFENAEKLLCYEEDIDILFLDIQMKKYSGMDAARELRKRGSDVTIIFVTGLKDYVYEAFDVGAFHYLVKPFDKVKFYEVLRKAINEREAIKVKNIKEEPSIVVKRGSLTSKIYLCDICFIEVFNRKIIIHKTYEDVEIYGKLSEIESRLPESFVRCHRANIVNLKYVQDYDRNTVVLENGKRLLLSKQKYPEFVKKYMQWMQAMQEEQTCRVQ